MAHHALAVTGTTAVGRCPDDDSGDVLSGTPVRAGPLELVGLAAVDRERLDLDQCLVGAGFGLVDRVGLDDAVARYQCLHRFLRSLDLDGHIK